MSFVLDTSVTLTWCFEDQQTPYTLDVLKALKTEQALVPPIWRLEVINGLLGAERKNFLSHDQCVNFLAFLESSNIVESNPISDNAVFLSLGLSYGLSAYDTGFLALASQSGFPLATIDKKLRNSTSRAGVELFQP